MAVRSALQRLSFLCLLILAVPSTTASAMAVTTAHHGLLLRDNGSCADSNSNRCSDPKLPSNFCCPKDSTCLSLDDSSSALCCPDGECTLIEPIVCDVNLQNPDKNPSNPLMTTKLDEDLPKCGKSCCPHGYSCEDNKVCRRKKSTSTTSSQTSTSTETSSTQTTSSITTTAAQGVTATATSTLFLFPTSVPEASSLEQDCPTFPGRAIAAGFFPGLITGALLALITIICIGQRRRKQAAQHAYASKANHMRKRSSDGAIIGISDPMPGEIQNSVRTDFLRQTPSYDGGASTNDTKSRFYRTGSRVKSLFNGSPKSTYSRREYRTSTPPPPIPPIYRPTPATPPDQVHPQRQPSTESIKVYSPEHIVRGHGSIRPDWMHPPNFGNNNNSTRPNTTFTEMMERVGFQGSNGDPQFKVTVTPPTQYPRDSSR